MDGNRFDLLTRGFANATSRRTVIKGVFAALASAILGDSTQADAATCRGPEIICRKNGDCCSNLCGAADRTGRRYCKCPPGQEVCGRKCANPAVDYASDPKNCGSCGHTCPRTKCQRAICSSGVCGLEPDPAAVNRSCDDGNPCTENDVCQANGNCAGTPKVCTTANQCATPICDVATGLCGESSKANNTPCNLDNNLCTQDTCQSGVCTAGPAIDCSTDSSVNDQCNTGICNTTTGLCEKLAKQDGTSCNADDDLCSVNDVCITGVCTAGSAKTCPDLNQCQINGTCDPDTGDCAYEFADGTTACNDGNPYCFDGFCCANPCTELNFVTQESTTICCQAGSVCKSIQVSAEPLLEAGICCEEAQDACITPGFANGIGTFDMVCCPSGQACASLDTSAVTSGSGPSGEIFGVCCDTGAAACIDLSFEGTSPSFESVCCASGETCQSAEIAQGFKLSTCCATEVCPITTFTSSTPGITLECCAAGTACSTTKVLGIDFGACCPDGSSINVDTSGGAPSVTCITPCAEPCNILTPSQSSSPVTETCCGVGEFCAPLGNVADVSELGVCCAAGQVACLDPNSLDSIPTSLKGVCCDSCTSYSTGGSTFSFCCPSGQDFCQLSPVSSPDSLGCCDGDCSTVLVDNIALSYCCPTGQVPIYSNQTITCIEEPTG